MSYSHNWPTIVTESYSFVLIFVFPGPSRRGNHNSWKQPKCRRNTRQRPQETNAYNNSYSVNRPSLKDLHGLWLAQNMQGPEFSLKLRWSYGFSQAQLGGRSSLPQPHHIFFPLCLHPKHTDHFQMFLEHHCIGQVPCNSHCSVSNLLSHAPLGLPRGAVHNR